MLKIDNVFNPPVAPANIIDLGTGTRNLTDEGLGALRATRKTDDDMRIIKEEVAPNRQMTADEYEDFVDEIGGAERLEAYDFDGTINSAKRILADDKAYEAEMFAQYKAGKLDPKPGEVNREKFLRKKFEEMELSGDKRLMTMDEIEELSAFDQSTLPLMSRIESQMNKIKGTSSKLDDAIKGYEDVYKPRGTNEIEALETMTRNKAGHEFITAYVDDVYKNAGAVSSVDVPKKRAAAREFLNLMLKKETDLLPQAKGGTLESVVSEADYKFITEGGGGALGDPLVLVKKYFGDEIAKRIPLDTRTEVMETFVDNVRFTKDRAGFPTDDPRFNPDDIPEFKHGGLAKILEV
jgi:hypothetical protein